MNIDTITLVAAGACVATFLIAKQVLRTHARLACPTLLAAVVAALAAIGFLADDSLPDELLLAPYQALGIAIPFGILLLATMFLGRRTQSSRAADSQPHATPVTHHRSSRAGGRAEDDLPAPAGTTSLAGQTDQPEPAIHAGSRTSATHHRADQDPDSR